MTGHNLNLILTSNFEVVEWDNYHDFNVVKNHFSYVDIKFLLDIVVEHNFTMQIFNQENQIIINIIIA